MSRFKKRPVCWFAIGFLVLICICLEGRNRQEETWETAERLQIEGIITDKQYKETTYGAYWQVTIKKVVVRHEKEASLSLEGKYLCQILAEDAPEVKLGQQVLLEGTSSPWEAPANPGQFDFQKYYRSLGIFGRFQKCSVIRLGSHYAKEKESLWQIRQRVYTYLRQTLGEEDGALLGAMLLGEKSQLDEETKHLYQRNGISHILAISGLHLSLLGMGVFRFLQALAGKKKAAVCSIFMMIVYCMFTGSSVSAVRATLMFVLSLAAVLLGRSYDSLSALGLAALVQVFFQPYALYQSGFLLSFLAVLGVTVAAPRLQECLGAKGKLAQSLCVSLAASMTTLPVILVSYHTYPWYSVFLNVLILPMMSVLLLSAGILTAGCFPAETLLFSREIAENAGTAVLPMVLAWGKKLIVFVIKLILGYFEICCKGFEETLFLDGFMGTPGKVQLVLFYLLLLAVVCGWVRFSPMAEKLLLLTAVSLLTVQIRTGTEITMLDVGQGDCVVIRDNNQKVYISDCGSSSVRQVGKYRLLPFLKYKGYGKIQGIFLSHMDEDHRNGIVELLEAAKEERITISYLFLPESVRENPKDQEALEELICLTQQTETAIVYLKQGDRISDGAAEFICLHPGEQSRGVEDRNQSSLTIYMREREFELLLTGDLTKEGEEEMLPFLETEGGVEVLKVAHHGSSGSSSEAFLQKARPQLSLISCGKQNSYGHPHEETLHRLQEAESQILTTADSGAITLTVGKRKWTIDTWK